MPSSVHLDTSATEQLAATLLRLGDQVTELDEAHADAAALLLRGVNPPRRSGQLAAAGRADASPNGFTLAYPIRYATFVHWGAPRRNIRAHPWLLEASNRDADQLDQLYGAAVRDNINRTI